MCCYDTRDSQRVLFANDAICDGKRAPIIPSYATDTINGVRPHPARAKSKHTLSLTYTIYKSPYNGYNSHIMIELNKKYKSGSAVEILCEAILSGDIPSGITLTQNELALSLGTSRMPVREALIILEYQGLIERSTSQHIRVINLDEASVRDVFADMSVLELEALKNLPDDQISRLSSCTPQHEFHKALITSIKAPFRRRTLTTLTEIYLAFVLTHCKDISKIDAVFMNLIHALTTPLDTGMLRAAYAVYSEVLASELMRIRRNNHA